MTIIGQIQETDGNNFPSLKELVGLETQEKKRILSYLRSGTVVSAAPGIMKDVLNGEPTGREMLVYSDGQYAWKSDVIYYVEKYNMRLPEEFIDHIMTS